ncbi:YczE/YyaS/YitT family protein [Evansella cellulosilytica]|uniref:YitT family protein n=1 Tax=Evansella cellulosilytica (strain ATCC 21833 / DSM 2522 / FERM P-1141 / JCM 9156 / N-4) TaxID=649639 RepID=E6TX13_EVAC2|nr:hypothetical protein [Evansella cellulosilytica]ADU31102.1 protein of unknown function DUF161 [Evansella cellulosilytica DSM 2522]
MKQSFIIGMFYITGIFFLSFGISLMILSNLGVGPWDALFVGLSINVGLTVGSWIFIIGFLLIFINAYLMKKTPDFSAVITIFLVGAFLDMWLEVVFRNIEIIQLVTQVPVLFVGILFIALGISTYLQSSFARNPIDQLMMAIHIRTGKSIAFSKTVMELTVLTIAFFIGGPIGIGTIVAAVVMGKLIETFYKPVSLFRKNVCSIIQ